MSKPSFHLKNTLKNFPDLAPPKQQGNKLNGNSSPSDNQPVQPQPAMGTKSVSTTALPTPDNSVVQYHSSPDFLPSSATSTSSIAQGADGVIAPGASVPALAMVLVNGVIQKIDGFLGTPDTSLDNFSDICQSLKDLGENVNFKKLKKHSQYSDVVEKLAPKIVAFWESAQNRSAQLFEGAQFNLFQVGRVSYGLKACIELDKEGDFFSQENWKNLRPAICKLMRVVFDRIYEKKLLGGVKEGDVGSILALIDWLDNGVHHMVPIEASASTSTSDSPNFKGLLTGFSRRENSPSLLDIGNSAIDTLLTMQTNAFDTRQLGKMLVRFGRMIEDGRLGFEAHKEWPHADPEKLRNLVVGVLGPTASNDYWEKQHDLPKDTVNVIAIDNLSEGARVLFDQGVLAWDNKSHISVAVKVANFIKLAAPFADKNNLKKYRKFLVRAFNNVTGNARGAFSEAWKALGIKS